MSFEKEFEVGDVASLRSGGPTLTVEKIDANGKTLHCRWFDYNDRLCVASFPREVLVRKD